ncbi:Ubiquinone biosynthesis protein Coq7, putative [Penicillium digitatum]|uniref:5-demethoxyubiquinone hydroxylase, mitochondrial n=3 Tax=Penicillium digitatum TaxID=36651 RepID=K9F826_PEND2|nr:Ubiquinone biosynthesis protein Coq7, putative [Penicillium digitatum Pd1]EKV04212.1 Ubiquinone biosynthesis protein Coq7, putative [Penicillium digitatum PHI26]EKV21339.1 Ubiquinone biosynthesis protein Coq7, putative [Penicillium digitatum Pd1]QQK48037.1 Ubiquinone biosynthesis protein Coq7, putative [Penicillium digitatum]
MKGGRYGGYRKKRVDCRRKLAFAVNYMTFNAKLMIGARQRQGGLSDQYVTSELCALSHSSQSAPTTLPLLLHFLVSSTSKHGQCRQASTNAGTVGGSKPLYVLSKEQREFMNSALRVNQAGELAATLIYKAQTPQIVRSHPHLRPLMKHMYDQEAGHLKTFNHLITKHRIRPTAMYPAWEIAATFLGWSTAALGREAAMACTEAVETEIGSHYNDQVREILSWEADAERWGEELDEELKEMLATLRRIRDEELEHLDHAVANDSKEAKPYDPLVDIIRLGCRTAIKISEKI